MIQLELIKNFFPPEIREKAPFYKYMLHENIRDAIAQKRKGFL